MPKKEWTHEERAAFGAKMKAAKASKEPRPSEQMIASEDYASLKREFEELKAMLSKPAGPTVGASGVTGVFEKYRLDPNFYPDPTARLSAETRLQPFAFPLNYELDWQIHTTTYEHNGVQTEEPRFILELHRVVLNEDGTPSPTRHVVNRLTFHEDPQAAVIVARENKFDIDSFGTEKQFLDEMRYIRMRDWLIECFYPPKPTVVKNRRQEVIGNRLVDVFEVNAEESQRMPFDEIKSKL